MYPIAFILTSIYFYLLLFTSIYFYLLLVAGTGFEPMTSGL